MTQELSSPQSMQAALTPAASLALHATAVVFRDQGLLLRGPSGAGKSSLALDLIASAASPACFVRLIGDDRVRLTAANGRLIARPYEAIKGLIEVRNIGIVRRPFEEACIVRGLIDLGGAAERMPGKDDGAIELLGIRIYHRTVNDRNLNASRIIHAIEDMFGTRDH